MNKQQFEQLLSQEESISLEFKESLDLKSNEGKAKFLREVLSLANSSADTAHLIIGVEDKTKRVIGMQGISEEQVQQIISEWCRPPINFDFRVVKYRRKSVGVMRIYPARPPYTLKKSIGYAEMADGKKQHRLRENQVFVRRGSTIDEATVDEIIEMAQRDEVDLFMVVSQLGRINDSLEEIAYSRDIADFDHPREEFSRYIETTFIAMLTGLIAAWLWKPDFFWLPILTTVVSFSILVTTSALRLTHFGIWRTLFTTVVISIGLGFSFEYGQDFVLTSQPIFADFTLRLVFGLLAGAVTGIVGQLLLGWFESRMVR